MNTAIIVGTGFSALNIQQTAEQIIKTPYGNALILKTRINNQKVFILARHGKSHTLAPHQINYRANIFALHSLGVTTIIAIAAVGVINQILDPNAIILPDQLIDYTYNREHTFSNETDIKHIDFTHPYHDTVRQKIINIAEKNNVPCVKTATYGITQGPRLETAAEVVRLKNDGCDIVGMTGMPEASLSREMDIDYATMAIFANWAAGVKTTQISMDDIRVNLKSGMCAVQKIIHGYFC